MEKDSKGRFKKGVKSWNAGKKLDNIKYKNMGFRKGDENPSRNPKIILKVKKILKKRCIRKTIFNKKITQAIHKRINKILGQPKICENCGITTKRKYDWANISGLYKEDPKDYIRLCISCHRLYDFGKIKVRRNYKYDKN